MQKIFITFLILTSQALFSQNIPVYNIIRGDIEQSTGYYFLNAYHTSNAALGMRNLILDRYGNIIYIKDSNPTGIDFKVHPNGKISFVRSIIGSPALLKFFIMDSTFFVKDSISCRNGFFTDAHDLLMLPNGHYMLFGFGFRTMNLTQYNYFNGNGSPGSANASVKYNVIQELDENKNLVWSWNSADHYSFDDVQPYWLSSPVNVDWTHVNSLEIDTDGNLLVSVRHFSEITKINRQTGAIMWRLGGKRNQFTFINDPHNGFHGQHDARRLPNGNLTLFDNGGSLNPLHPARGVEYVLDENSLTATLVWSYTYSNDSYSRFLGSMRRLDNGSSLVGWGRLQNRNTLFSSVNSGGAPVLEINFPDSLSTYRVFNYTSLPWQLNRPVLSCRDSSGVFFLDAPQGHTSYLWSTGAVTRSIKVSEIDTYYVFVPYGQDGYISSERFIVSNLSDPCSKIIGINPVNGIPDKFSLSQNYPNPFNPSTKISFSIPAGDYVKLTVYDAAGREIQKLAGSYYKPGSYEIEWNASEYPSGVYFYNMEVRHAGSPTGHYSSTRKMVLIK